MVALVIQMTCRFLTFQILILMLTYAFCNQKCHLLLCYLIGLVITILEPNRYFIIASLFFGCLILVPKPIWFECLTRKDDYV